MHSFAGGHAGGDDMFDIGFSELLVIAVVALIVIGPERLPRVARTLGHLFGRMQRYVNDVKADIAREMEVEDLRRLRETVEDAARSIQGSVEREINDARGELDKVASAVEPATDLPSAPASAAADSGTHRLNPASDAGATPEAQQPRAESRA